MKRALVLSGGGMFGAWQAGAWRALADRLQPDLIVGASVGSLNGYAIAGGATPDELADFWMQPHIGNLRALPQTIQSLMNCYSPRVEYAVVLTDLVRLKPRIFLRTLKPLPLVTARESSGSSVTSRDRRERLQESSRSEITWQHLAASCAIPGVLPQYKIDGRWYTDGGLLNPLPVWAAVELGATQIVALHALPTIPSIWMRPFVKGFRFAAGYNPPLPATVELTLIQTQGAIGSMSDALRWRSQNVERWLELGFRTAQNISIPVCSLDN